MSVCVCVCGRVGAAGISYHATRSYMDKLERLVQDAGAAAQLSTVVDKGGEVYRLVCVCVLSVCFACGMAPP